MQGAASGPMGSVQVLGEVAFVRRACGWPGPTKISLRFLAVEFVLLGVRVAGASARVVRACQLKVGCCLGFGCVC